MATTKGPRRPAETQEAQSERFIAMARELGADESEERFNAKLKKVAGAKVVAENSDEDSGKRPKLNPEVK